VKRTLSENLEYAILHILMGSTAHQGIHQDSWGEWESRVHNHVPDHFTPADLKDAFKRLHRKDWLRLYKGHPAQPHSGNDEDDPAFFFNGPFAATLTPEGRGYWDRLRVEKVQHGIFISHITEEIRDKEIRDRRSIPRFPVSGPRFRQKLSPKSEKAPSVPDPPRDFPGFPPDLPPGFPDDIKSIYGVDIPQKSGTIKQVASWGVGSQVLQQTVEARRREDNKYAVLLKPALRRAAVGITSGSLSLTTTVIMVIQAQAFKTFILTITRTARASGAPAPKKAPAV
jgi:hypothetical protein